MAAPKRFSWILWLIILAGLGAGGWFAWRKYAAAGSTGAVDYRTNSIARGDVVQSVTANGALTPVRNVEVGSQVSGIIKEINVDFNSVVKEGEVLAKIDPATYERALARDEADLLNTKAALEMAQFNYKRSIELFNSKLISETEHEQNKVALHQAEAQVKIREAQMESAKVDLERTTILAPISGVVITRAVDAGQTVASSFNTPRLFVIANDLAKMQIETMVSEADVGGVEVGQRVNFTVDAFPGRQFRGAVNQVRFAPTTNQNVVSYTTVVEVNNADLKLRPGMTANATIVTSQRTNVLRIPNSALRFNPPKDALILKGTNATILGAVAKPTNAVQIATSGPFAGLPVPPWNAGGERRRPTDEERTQYEASLTPEQKAQYQQIINRFRQRMAEGGGPGGPGGGGGGGGFGDGAPRRSSAPEGPMTRTVYLLQTGETETGVSKPVLKPVTIKTGISDGSNTEVLEGLKEGDVVVTGVNTAASAAPSVTPNPFGGPFGGPRR